jgi:hypothetical protein
VFIIINHFLDENEINWENCIGLCTDSLKCDSKNEKLWWFEKAVFFLDTFLHACTHGHSPDKGEMGCMP